MALNRKTVATWTIYDAETGDAVAFQSFLGADLTAEAKVVTAPIEQGSFVAYNKVHSPDEVNVAGAIKGDAAALNTALGRLLEMQKSTRLYNVVTPDHVYRGYNLYKLSYQRTVDSGTDLIVFEGRFMEIRQTSGQYTSSDVPHGTAHGAGGRTNRGRQQAPNRSLARMIGDKIRG